MARIAITGSSGLIGTALGSLLEGRGDTVLRVRRGDPGDPGAVWAPDRGWVREGALESLDAVVHLAGANLGEKRWSDARKRRLVSSRIDATRLLVDHLASLQSKPATLVSASAVGYYGSRGDKVLDEGSSGGEGFLADLCQRWEAEALRAEDVGIRVVTIRTAPVLDARGGMLQKMLLPFRLGIGGKIGGGQNWLSFVSLEDIARVYTFAIDNDVRGPLNGAAPEPVTNAGYTKALGRALHRPTVLPLPPAGLKVLFGGEMTDEMLTSSARVVPARLQESGFDFRHPTIDEALKAALG